MSPDSRFGSSRPGCFQFGSCQFGCCQFARRRFHRASRGQAVGALLLTAVLVVAVSPPPAAAQSSPVDDPQVVVNGEVLSATDLQVLQTRFGIRTQAGRYWYDPACGAWGFEGGPTIGFLPPALPVGGALREDASAGTTPVYINGRRLPITDVRNLQQIVGMVLPGRYWMDAAGNVGVEGGPPFMNLAVLARQAGRAASGNTFYRSDNTGIGAGSSGGTSYVMGEDWSVIVD